MTKWALWKCQLAMVKAVAFSCCDYFLILLNFRGMNGPQGEDLFMSCISELVLETREVSLQREVCFNSLIILIMIYV